MLRASEALAAAGDIVAAEPSLHRPPGSAPVPAALEGQVLKVASAFDELTEGQDEHARWAVEALYTGPGYVYDGRVLGGPPQPGPLPKNSRQPNQSAKTGVCWA